MQRLDYFLLALASGAYKKQDWVIRVFSQSNLPEAGSAVKYPYQLFQQNNQFVFADPTQDNKLVVIEDSKITQPLMSKNDVIELTSRQVVNLTKSIKTTAGNLLYNYICLIYPFGNKIPYQEGTIDIKHVEKLIVEKLQSDPTEEDTIDPNVIYVFELNKYLKATYALVAYAQLFVPSATKYTMTGSPDAKKLLAQRLEEHKHELTDPAVIAIIAREVEQVDRAYVEQDPDKGFYQSDKAFKVVRMRNFYMHGLEFDFSTNEGTFVKNSLEAQWDVSTLPQLNNASRDGSFKRGAMTALGGEKTKTIFRVMSGAVIASDDCNTTLGLPVTLTKDNSDKFLGSYALVKQKNVLLTKEEIASLFGQNILVRSPLFCKADSNDYCTKCMGSFVKGKEKALGAIAAEVGTTLMSVYMRGMHFQSIQVNSYDINTALS